MNAPLHVTFCTREYRRSARELQRGVESWGLRTRCYTPQDQAVRRLSRRFPLIMRQKRGAGFWLWKPAIILDALRQSAEGDVVLYTDAGVQFVDDPRRLTDLVADRPISLFDHPRAREGMPGFAQRNWTKRDCFALLNADNEVYWNRQQIAAAFQVYRNCNEARSFVEEWFDAAVDDRVLTDRPNTMGLPNFDGFVAHRHDQSVLTIVATRHEIPTWPSPETDGELGPRVLDHFRRRPSWILSRTERLRALLKARTRLKALVERLQGGAQ